MFVNHLPWKVCDSTPAHYCDLVGPRPLYAKDQFVTLACGVISTGSHNHPPPSTSQSPVVTNSQGCGGGHTDVEVGGSSHNRALGLLPMWLLVECIGKRWVMAKERVITVSLSPYTPTSRHGHDHDDSDILASKFSPTNLCTVQSSGQPSLKEEDRLQVAMSGTLGLLAWKVDSVIMSCGDNFYGAGSLVCGHIGDEKELRCGEDPNMFFFPTYQVYLHVRTAASDSGRDCVLMGDIMSEPLTCCNESWILLGVLDHHKLYVWRSTSPGEQPVKVIELPMLATAVSMKFFCPAERDPHCNDVEIIFTKEELNTEVLCVAHFNVKGAVDFPHRSQSYWLRSIGSATLPEGISALTLGQPLVNRSTEDYFFPFERYSASSQQLQQNLLHLRTGNVLTWLADSTGIAVRAVDESHLATTDGNNITTSVFSLHDLSSQFSAGSGNQQTQVEPIFVHKHPNGTVQVSVGCGLVISSRIIQSHCVLQAPHKQEEQQENEFVATRRNAPVVPYCSATHTYCHIGSQHDLCDVATGSLLFSFRYNNKVMLPRALSVDKT